MDQVRETAPRVKVTGVQDSATYILGDVPTAGCETYDNLSGIVTEATISLTGGNPYGTGTFIATCSSAMDKAGNSSTEVTVKYMVIFPVKAIQDLVSGVDTLFDLRILNGRETIVLVNELEDASKKLDTSWNPNPVLVDLNTFINQVDSLIDDGSLSKEQGQALVDAAQAIINAIM